jgi:hypothetical protein
MRFIAAIGTVLLLSACEGQVVELAGTKGDAGPTDPMGNGGPATLDVAVSPLPAECANPGPFQNAAASASSQLVGTWINCGGSVFVGAEVPLDEAGVLVRADMTWQKFGVSAGKVVLLTQHEDYGTWSVYGGDMLLLTWDTGNIATAPQVATNGRSLFVTTAAGGNQVTLAKAAGTP